MKRRPVTPFSLSFLDIMFCGFGAVVLLVLIINADTVQARNEVFADLRADVVRMENELIIGEENRVIARNSLKASEQALVLTRGDAARVQNSLLEIEAGLTDLNLETSASRSHINKLKSDLKGLDKTTQQLSAEREAQGDKVHQYAGEGDRQYLTGLKLGGKRILILLDVSASMLDETIVNIIRLRNLDDNSKRAAEKWQRGRNTAEWLIANLPQSAKFQLHFFNTTSRPALADNQNRWLSANSPADINGVVKALRELIPAGGTSLYQAFKAARKLEPRPDNILLITDGLPTQGRRTPSGTTVTSQQRVVHFNRAAELIPSGIPVNTILLPMEGDVYAAAAYWKLAVNTHGSFLTPARDWP
ncbi:MAG: VWA domain-containing protein [Proteobacteria bacterium]|nr:VWA domain-containing protein [Pseudomonadota bacterium]